MIINEKNSIFSTFFKTLQSVIRQSSPKQISPSDPICNKVFQFPFLMKLKFFSTKSRHLSCCLPCFLIPMGVVNVSFFIGFALSDRNRCLSHRSLLHFIKLTISRYLYISINLCQLRKKVQCIFIRSLIHFALKCETHIEKFFGSEINGKHPFFPTNISVFVSDL